MRINRSGAGFPHIPFIAVHVQHSYVAVKRIQTRRVVWSHAPLNPSVCAAFYTGTVPPVSTLGLTKNIWKSGGRCRTETRHMARKVYWSVCNAVRQRRLIHKNWKLDAKWECRFCSSRRVRGTAVEIYVWSASTNFSDFFRGRHRPIKDTTLSCNNALQSFGQIWVCYDSAEKSRFASNSNLHSFDVAIFLQHFCH